jgi:hypothetical protein
MMTLGPIGFLSPWLLTALLALPVIWWLLRITPPGPTHIRFPATRLLLGLERKEEDRAHSPWWLTMIRLLAAAAIILALSRPVINPETRLAGGSEQVVIVVDNGWASADDWAARHATLSRLLQAAEEAGQQVVLVASADPNKRPSLVPQKARTALEKTASLTPMPYPPDRLNVLNRLEKSNLGNGPRRIVWLSDGLSHGKGRQFIDGLIRFAGGADRLSLFSRGPAANGPLALSAALDGAGQFKARVISPGGLKTKGRVIARDQKGRPLGKQAFTLSSGDKAQKIGFELPLELRNQIARLDIEGHRSAGATFLIDGLASRRRVGLLSGETVEEAQPLLSPLYYVRKALAPHAEISLTDDRNTASAIDQLLKQQVTTLVLADIGRLGFLTRESLEEWLQRGGILIRFAGPRLEQGGDGLLPVELREGGRALGGALTWSKPQKLGSFETGSPFLGLTPADDVAVRRQVLADPSQMTDDVLVWARLEDGTPLVTARRSGRGLLVLFHVTANSSWSNLPLSGLFVDMLRRINDLSTGVITTAEASAMPTTAPQTSVNTGDTGDAAQILPPHLLLDGFGALKKAAPEAAPLTISDLETYRPSAMHPPGLYGPSGSSRAVNLANDETKLTALPKLPNAVQLAIYDNTATTPLAPLLFAAALSLFLVDGIAVLLLGGLLTGIGGKSARQTASILVLAGLTTLVLPLSSRAADDKMDPRAETFALQMTMQTRLAFVRSADPVLNRNARLGLKALSDELTRRTAFEPGDPVGIDIARDELAFFPIIYWPVPDKIDELEQKTVDRVNAYMKQGGVILFDTRNRISNFTRPGTQGMDRGPLAKLLGLMDIPPLEPVPSDHVLTRSFYLLDRFPGRWSGGRLWVEATAKANAQDANGARSADGVSTLLITSNNLAEAWARDETGRPLYPVVPGGEAQREISYRSGINIVMYALTGNYKADQVHLPALMRRLGQ